VGQGDGGAYVVSAPVADGVVVVERELASDERGELFARRAALRFTDGTWAALPDPPPLRSPTLVQVGDVVVLVGGRCADERCDQSVVAASRLSTDRRRWSELDLPAIEVADGTGPIGGQGDRGLVATGPRLLSFDRDGEVTLLPDWPDEGDSDVLCQVDDVLVSIGLRQVGTPEERGYDPMRYEFVGVQVLDLEAPTEWRRGAEPPDGDAAYATRLCGLDEVVIATDGTEWTYRPHHDVWSTRPVALPEPLVAAPLLGDTAVGRDGLAAGLAGREVVVRHPDGAWSATGLVADHLLVSGSSIVAVDARSQTYTPLGG
jgi:hypothetical protein